MANPPDAAVTGLGAVTLGYPFLTTHTAHLSLPMLGAVHLPSATFFDLGVFAVVAFVSLLGVFVNKVAPLD